MKEPIVLLAHYDLDGAGCSVLADHIWQVVARRHQGYPKIRKSLDFLVDQYADQIPTIVIADLKIEEQDLRYACENFDNVIYYDHHEDSESFADLHHEYPNFEFHFDLDYCSASLMWMDGVRTKGAIRTKELDSFMNTVHVYDLWIKDNSRWEDAMLLNDLFWELHMDDFRDRFSGGLGQFTVRELDFKKGLEEKRRKIISEATIEKTEAGSTVVLIGDSKAINFVSDYMDGDLFYIISPDYAAHNVSVRKKDGFDMNINAGLQEFEKAYPDEIQSAGGHKVSGGITFKQHLSVNEMVELILFEDDNIRANGGVQ